MSNPHYRPLRDSDGEVIEPETVYVGRVSSLLSNFPPDVLGQWFYDHHQQFEDDYGWLGFERLSFRLAYWRTDEIPTHDFGHDELLRDRVGYFRDVDEKSQRHDRLWRYTCERGTWPRPIIVLHNPDGRLHFPNGLALGAPFHLLEGHNRVAALSAAAGAGVALTDAHAVWMAWVPELAA